MRRRSPSVLPARVKAATKELTVPMLRAVDACRARPSRVVLILAHMRSGSTLLQHVLASHPTIWGRGERNRPYSTSRDLDRLVVDVCYYHKRLPQPGAFFLDQVNHSRFLPSRDILNHERVTRIFLIREPSESIDSMIDTLGSRYQGWSRREAIDYYKARLDALSRYAEEAEDRARQFFFTYADLVGENRQLLLRSLGRFLNLREELSPEYEIFGYTGKSGDPSARIFEGRIVEGRRRRTISMPEDEELADLFERCRAVLTASCGTYEAT